MFSIIVAFDDNNLIGRNNDLPWHFKEDLAYFKKVTTGHRCLMGRKTYESILNRLNKPLPNRESIVVSRHLKDERVKVIDDLEAYLKKHMHSDEEMFIIGGQKVYETALPYAKRLYITHIKGSYEGDAYFPYINYRKFSRIYYEEQQNLAFAIYERIKT